MLLHAAGLAEEFARQLSTALGTCRSANSTGALKSARHAASLPQNEKCLGPGPRHGAHRDGERYFAAANLPLPTFLNLDSFPLALISLMIAALRVALGVLPLVCQSFCLRMRSAMSAQPIGCLDPASTLAAASRPLMRFGLFGFAGARGGFAARFAGFGVLPLATAGADAVCAAGAGDGDVLAVGLLGAGLLLLVFFMICSVWFEALAGPTLGPAAHGGAGPRR
jgi:hypothetical protein